MNHIPIFGGKNAHVESFFSILETEFIQTHYFGSMSEAYELTHSFIDFYNQRRIHKSLKYKNHLLIVRKTCPNLLP